MFRKTIQFITLLALFMLCFVSCQVNKPVDENKIAEVNAQFMQSFKDRDAQAVASFYTEDAIVMPPYSEALTTPEDITDLWQGMFDLGITEVNLVSIEIIPAGEYAIESGEYTVYAENNELDQGKLLVVWKNVNGQWKLHRDIWNSSIPVEEVVEDVVEEGMIDEDTE